VPNKRHDSEEKFPFQSAGDDSPGGVFGKLARWWRGPSPVTVRVPTTPPGAITPGRALTPPSTRPAPSTPVSKVAPPPPGSGASIIQSTLPSGSGAERVHTALRLGQLEE